MIFKLFEMLRGAPSPAEHTRTPSGSIEEPSPPAPAALPALELPAPRAGFYVVEEGLDMSGFRENFYGLSYSTGEDQDSVLSLGRPNEMPLQLLLLLQDPMLFEHGALFRLLTMSDWWELASALWSRHEPGEHSSPVLEAKHLRASAEQVQDLLRRHPVLDTGAMCNLYCDAMDALSRPREAQVWGWGEESVERWLKDPSRQEYSDAARKYVLFLENWMVQHLRSENFPVTLRDGQWGPRAVIELPGYRPLAYVRDAGYED
ncbi:hypothetical protein D3C71_18790 [compost metagenome]